MAMKPGLYLKKRREAAGLSLDQVARSLGALPWAIRPVGGSELTRLILRLHAVEKTRIVMTLPQLQLMRNVFALDAGVYLALVDSHFAGSGSGLPEPHVCRECGCSWLVACQTSHGPCAWSDHNGDLCTACDPAYAHVARQAPPVPHLGDVA